MNTLQLPKIGFGTYKLTKEEAPKAVKNAILTGYRYIDTASFYKNEEEVGEGIRESEIKREDIMIATKVWNTDRGYKNTLLSFERSLNKLQLDYIDVFLIHWPCNHNVKTNWDEENVETWEALIKLYNEDKVKTIGVCNFKPKHLDSLMKSSVSPMINQIEFHPGFYQEETLSYSKEHDIIVQAWSPLGRNTLNEIPQLKDLTAKYKCNMNDICLSWEEYHGVMPLPKASSLEHMKANFNYKHIPLTLDEIKVIDSLPLCGGKGVDSDEVNYQ